MDKFKTTTQAHNLGSSDLKNDIRAKMINGKVDLLKNFTILQYLKLCDTL